MMEKVDIIYLSERKPYITLATCIINEMLSNKNLTNLEKNYYILVDLYSNINESIHGLRETEKSGQEWANLLNCSEGWIFKMQKHLEAAGYFRILREKDEDNQNEKNIIIPTLPDCSFTELCQAPNRVGKEHLVFIENNHEGCKRSYLDSSKMFIKFNLQMIKVLLAGDDSLTSLQKLMWIYFFCRSHIAYTDRDGEGTRNFITTYKEIAAVFSCKENTVSIGVNKLEEFGYISKKQFRIKDKRAGGRRKKKSCWEISALFPQEKMGTLLQQPDRQNLPPITIDDVRLYGLDQAANRQPPLVSEQFYYHASSGGSHETSQYYNKYNISNINKNTDQATKQLTNNNQLQSNVINVSLNEELTASPAEIELGLKIAEKFDKTAFALEKHIPWENAIKQADQSLTNVEHWIVTKTAFTLQQQYAKTANNLLVADEQFTDPELRLIELWNGFSGKPEDEVNEFLLRKSWVLKLLEANTTITPQPVITKAIALPESIELEPLPGDKQDKAVKFAYALRERMVAQGYAAEITVESLAQEFIYHAATWVPEKLNCKTRVEQIDAALSFAWRAAEQGRWRCPYGWLNANIQQREKEAAQWKRW